MHSCEITALCSVAMYETNVLLSSQDLMELLEFFPKCLDEACTYRPVVLMLDSLDQLPTGEGGRRLDWLPRKLPNNCYLIMSTLPGSEYECLPLLKVTRELSVHVDNDKVTWSTLVMKTHAC